MVKFLKLYLDFLRNLTVQTTLFAVAVIVSVESNLDLKTLDFSNAKNSIPFVGLMIMLVVAAVGNTLVFLDGIGDLALDDGQKDQLNKKRGLERGLLFFDILYKHHKIFCATVLFSFFAIMFGVVVTWFAGMPLMAGIYNAIHAK